MPRIEELSHYDVIEKWIMERLSRFGRRPFFVGINAPQGAGKTTLCKVLMDRFAKLGLRSIVRWA